MAALTKNTLPINFSKGLDTKTDNKQVQLGKFLALRNSVFDTEGRLTKRNGFNKITTLPNTDQTTITTINDNLVATGSSLYAYAQDINDWVNQGTVQPVSLSTTAVVRSSSNQTGPDSQTASNGLTCVAYMDGSVACYKVVDSATGQAVVQRTTLPANSLSPRVFLLNRSFIITFLITIGGTPEMQYIAIPVASPSVPSTAATITATITSTSAGYDGFVANNTLYMAWADAGGDIRVAYLTSAFTLSSAVTLTTKQADFLSVTADITASTPVIWVSFHEASTSKIWAGAVDPALNTVCAVTQIAATVSACEITSAAKNQTLTMFWENINNYNSTGAYPAANIRTDYITKSTLTQAGVAGTPSIILRSVGLNSKAFIDPTSGGIYMIASYNGTNQPTYFLIDSSGNIYMRLAYSKGGGRAANQVLPSISFVDDQIYFSYLFVDLLATVNKNTDLPTGQNRNNVYTQTGVNLAQFSINANVQQSNEIAGCLHLTGGQLWQYDGTKPVELGFHLWPENIQSTTTTGSGGLVAQTYFYQFCYEWTDNQGNLHRSAPSIPRVQVTTTASSTNTLYVPTLRTTYKVTPNPIRIVGYRWSTAQPVYYQFTSLTSPNLNDPSVDYITITDANADNAILGLPIIYTTGGVLENIAPPACTDSALFKNRLFLINAENENELWYSKQVIQNTPVEMSSFLTLFIAPTTGAQGSTGKAKCISSMDDKLIIFKQNALYYLTGTGPDNTGAGNDFTDPVFITGNVGSDNPNSIVMTPNGLMFQSDKGIWLLARDLTTKYIGAPVEAFNNVSVKSAQAIPGTNQVRFILDNNITLMYDYYFDQWGAFTNTRAISATLYQGRHTYLNAFGEVLKETPGSYLDGSRPVLLSFTTSWVNIAGIQGYERFYYLHLLGTYITPFKLNVSIGYDYNASPSQAVQVLPDNFSENWGGEAVWGAGETWGGPANVLSARVFPEVQKCEAFQITVEEVYDASYGVPAGQGFNLSGLAVTVGVKRGTRTQKSSQSFG